MTSRTARILWFALSLLAGLGLGLLFGWYLQPGDPDGAALAELRADYQADYVLMTAQAYQADRALAPALLRLQKLGEPAAVTRAALVTAAELRYSAADLATLEALAAALQPAALPTTAQGP